MIRILTLALSMIFFVGCDHSAPSPQVDSKPPQEVTNKIDTLTRRIDDLANELRSARTDIGSLKLRLSVAEDRYSSATFDPAEKWFQRVDANLGTFAVSLQDVKRFADGVKVRINVGNLSSATFAGIKLSLRYGQRLPDTSAANFGEAYSAWNEGLKSKEEEITQTLRPGNWNPIEVALPEIEESKFGYLEVRIATDHIELYK